MMVSSRGTLVNKESTSKDAINKPDLRKLVKIDMLNWNMIVFISPMFYYYYYCYYRCYYYYYCYYHYYCCLGLPETAFPKRLTVLPLKIATNITDVDSNVLLVRSTQQRKWYIAEAVITQTFNISSLQIYKVRNSRVTCSCSLISLFFHLFSFSLKNTFSYTQLLEAWAV